MSAIWLAHVTCYDPALPGNRVMYFSSQGYTTGATNYPASGAAHTPYDSRIMQPALMRRDCFDKGTTGGESSVGYGMLDLVNIDGGLDGLADVGLDGQSLEIIIGVVKPDSSGVPVWTTVLMGTMEQPQISWDKVSIILRDRQAQLAAKPLSPNTYGGTNSLPNGLDGVADLKGKNKPVCWGKVFNIVPPCVNTSKLIYQANDGVVADIPAVYDRGASITKGTDYATGTLLQAAAPGAGTYITCFAEGFFRLGSSPTGMITADVTQGATSANRTAAQILQAIVTGSGGVSSGDVTAADITALDSANSAEVGWWSFDASTCNAALDAIANSVGAYWGFDRLGKFRCARLEAPSGTPVANLQRADIIKIDRVATNDAGRGVPAWKVRLNYKKYGTAQTSDIAGSVTDAVRADLAQAWRNVESSDAAILTRHLLAPILDFDTLLIDATAAQTECDRRLTLYKAERARYDARIALDSALVASIDLGAVVSVTLPRFGMSGGKLLRVIGLRPDLRLNLLDITFWG